MRNVNVFVNSLTGKKERNVGKVVFHKGRWIHHQYIQDKWKRRDLDAWGVNTALLDYLRKHGVETIYLYAADSNVTYAVPVGLLDEYGTKSSRHDWGENINLPIEEWGVIQGNIGAPWVDKACAIRLQPAPLTVKEEVPEEEPEHDTAQLGLFA